MSTPLKHVANYGGRKAVVLYREVPGEPENCLIVLSDSLKEREHVEFMEVITGSEAQDTSNLAGVLNRRMFSDGATMLGALHSSGRIKKVKVAEVNLVPVPNHEVPLADVNAEIRKAENGDVPPITDPSHLEKPQAKVEEDAPTAEGLWVQAELIEGEAQLLLQEAQRKKAQARELDPNVGSKKAE